ncbi:MAG: hypothetical protein H0T84_07760 [Tatlockia sp.]|nr:hypothetical protein [Tatlockia sp.]
MKQKTEIKLYKGKGFSTIEQSPLSQMLKPLEKLLNEILLKDKQNGKNSSLEHEHSLKQLNFIKDNLDDVKNCLEAFSEGNGPGLMSLGFINSAKNLRSVYKGSTELFTPEYAAFKVIEDRLDDAISESLKQTKLQKITNENKVFFINSLKKELRKGPKDRFDLAKSIPGCNLDQFFKDLDLAIDASFEFCNELTRTKDETLAQILKSGLSTTLSNILFGYLNPQDEFIDGKYKRKHLNIVDPIIHDFALGILELLTIAPKEFKDLVPFFNSPIITVGAVPWLADTVLGYSITHERDDKSPKNETNALHYTYKIKGKDTDETIDMEKEYQEYLDEGIKTLAEAVAKYYIDYAHNPHVKNELAKGEPGSDLVRKFIEPRAILINKFITKEKLLEEKCIAALGNALELDSKIMDENTIEENIIFLKSMVNLLTDSQKEFINLQTRKANYDKISVKALMEKSNLANDLFYAREAGLDLTQPLPTFLIIKNSVEIYEPIALATLQQMGEAVIEQNNKVDAKINEIRAQIKKEVQKWCIKEIALHEKNNLIFITQLNELVENASLQIEPFAGNADARMNAIQKQIELLNNKIATLPDSIQIAENMQLDFNQPPKCTKELVELDENITKVADGCYKSSREQAKQTIEQLNGLKSIFKMQSEELMAEFNRAKADKALVEMMATANPAPVLELIKIKDTRKLDLELRSKALAENLVQLKTELEDSNFDIKLGRSTDPLQNTDPMVELKTKLTNTQIETMKILSPTMLLILKKFSVEKPEINSEEKLSTLEGSELASELFSEEKLSTLEGARQARDWLVTIMDKYSKEGEKYQGAEKKDLSTSMKVSSQLKDALATAKDIIVKAQGGFPYGALNDKLDIIFDLKWDLTKLNFNFTDGFDHLLEQLKDPYHTKAQWSRNKNYPKANNVKGDITSLLSLLDDKSTELKNVCTEQEILVTYKKEHTNLLNLYNSVADLHRANNNLMTEIQERESLAKREIILNEDIKTIDIKLGIINEELDNLIVSIDLLKPIAELLIQNQSLSQLIGKIERTMLELNTATLLNKNQTLLIELLLSARKQLKSILDSVPLVEANINLIEDKTLFNDNINKIKSLLIEGEAKLSKFEMNICTIKRDNILNQIKRNKDELTAIETIIINQAENLYSLDLLNQILPRYLNLSCETALTIKNRDSLKIDHLSFSIKNELTKTDLALDELCKNVNSIESALLFQGLKLLDNLTADFLNIHIDQMAEFPLGQLIQLKISLELLKPKSGVALLKLNTLIKGFVEQAKIVVKNFSGKLLENQQKITNLEDNEIKQTQVANKKTLTEVLSFIEQVPLTQLDLVKASLNLLKPQSNTLLTKLAHFSESFGEFTEQATRAKALNEQLVARVSKREEFVGRVRGEITNYHRERQNRYPVKDYFFSKDLEVRNGYVNQLDVLLGNYAEFGDPNPVVEYINNKQFPGVNLQPIINRLKLGIKDHETVVKVIPDHSKNYFDAAQILINLEQNPKNHAFIKRIRVLNNKIELIYNFSNSLEDSNEKTIAQDLAKSLLQQVHIFVIANHNLSEQGNIGDNEFKNLLDNFKADFDCLLHSQDDVLSKHYSWKTIVANIGLAVLAIFTLGASVGAMYGFHGAAFFKADAIEYIDKVEETLNDVSAPVA